MTDEEMDAAAAIASEMKRVARWYYYDGRAREPRMQKYLKRCRRVLDNGTSLLFTHDQGMHTSGWWKNPDYEQCLHLSLSFFDPELFRRGREEATERWNDAYAPHDHKAAAQWVRLFFGGMENLVWVEPPFSPEGKLRDVYHYRVFTAPDFRTPLLPRGEVYSKEFTEAGWKSWSDLHAEPQETAHT